MAGGPGAGRHTGGRRRTSSSSSPSASICASTPYSAARSASGPVSTVSPPLAVACRAGKAERIVSPRWPRTRIRYRYGARSPWAPVTFSPRAGCTGLLAVARPRDLHTAPFVGPGEPAVQVTGEAAREMGIVGGRVAFLPGAGQDQRLGMLDDIGVDRLRRGLLPGGQQPPVQRLAAAVENCGWMRTVPALITGTAFTGPGALGSPGDTAVKAFMAGISSPQEGRQGLHTHSAAVKKDSAGPALIGLNTAVAGQSRGAENLGPSDAEGLEQFGELVAEAGAELGDGQVSEAGEDGARLAGGEPGPVAGVDVDQRAQRRAEHHRRVAAVDLLREGGAAHQAVHGLRSAAVVPGRVMTARQYRTKHAGRA